MVRVHRRNRPLMAALVLAAMGGPAASAQGPPPAAVPLRAPTMPGPAVETGPAPALADESAGPSVVPAAPGAQGCTCGDRRGLSRWRWHRRNCKRKLQDSVIGFAEEFNEWPLGEALYAHARTQITNHQAARMVFYHCDFVDGTSQLNARGRDKLATVAATLPTTFFPIVVERTLRQPGLDESRKSFLLAELGRGSFPIPAERILIGPDVSHGMTGFESLIAIYPRQISNIASGGAIGGAGATGFVGGGLDFNAGGLSGGAVGGLGAVGP